MSQRRQQRRAKQVRRTNVRAAQRAKRPPTPTDIALRVVRDHAVPLASRDPLDAELVSSVLMAGGWEHVLEAPADIANELPHPALPVISLLRNLRVEPGELADAALALAHALVAADRQDPQVVAAGGVLVEQLREAGASDPVWAGETGNYELRAAFDIHDVWIVQHQLLLTFVDGAGREHGLMVLIDREHGLQVVELEVIDDPGTALAEMRATLAAGDEAAFMRIAEISPARAGGMLKGALEGTFNAHGDELVEGGDAELLQVLIAREELLAEVAAADWDEANGTVFDSDLEALQPDALRARFESSAERAAAPGATDEAITPLIEWVQRYAYPRALFGPAQVRAWARFCGTLANLDEVVMSDVLSAIDHYAPMHEQALLDIVATGA
jgi:hypothetical protein